MHVYTHASITESLSSENGFCKYELNETFSAVSLNKSSHAVWKAVCVLGFSSITGCHYSSTSSNELIKSVLIFDRILFSFVFKERYDLRLLSITIFLLLDYRAIPVCNPVFD